MTATTAPELHGYRGRFRMNIKESLGKLNAIDGFVGAAIVDSESGMLLGQEAARA